MLESCVLSSTQRTQHTEPPDLGAGAVWTSRLPEAGSKAVGSAPSPGWGGMDGMSQMFSPPLVLWGSGGSWG